MTRYKPAIHESDSSLVSYELTEAHKDRQHVRVLNRLLKSKESTTTRSEISASGILIYYYHKSSRQKYPSGWKPGSVKDVSELFVEIVNDNERPSKVAFENISLRPTIGLTEELSAGVFEEFVCNMNNEVTVPSVSASRSAEGQ